MSGTRKHLTNTLARKARPKASEYAIGDTGLQGFALRIQPSGAKAWILRLQVDGEARRVTLGSPDQMSAEEARTRALQLRLDQQPAPIRQQARSVPDAITFQQLGQDLLEARQDAWAPGTLRAFTIYLKAQLLPAFGHRPINRLTTAEIADWFYTYSRVRPGGANQALTHLRTIVSTGLILPRSAKVKIPS